MGAGGAGPQADPHNWGAGRGGSAEGGAHAARSRGGRPRRHHRGGCGTR
ncbi:MAG: RNA chaperone Hfq, partial [Gammaproteobacteria bacterium]